MRDRAEHCLASSRKRPFFARFPVRSVECADLGHECTTARVFAPGGIAAPSCGETAPKADRIKCPRPLLLKAESMVSGTGVLALMTSANSGNTPFPPSRGRSSIRGPSPNLMRGHLIVAGFYDNKVFFGASNIKCRDTKIGLYTMTWRH